MKQILSFIAFLPVMQSDSHREGVAAGIVIMFCFGVGLGIHDYVTRNK